MLSPDSWQFYGIVVTQLGAGLVVWLKVRGNRQHIENAAREAKKAAEWAEPTGNGFADEVRDGFRDVGDRLTRLENIATDAAEDIRNHKDAHVLESLRRHM